MSDQPSKQIYMFFLIFEPPYSLLFARLRSLELPRRELVELRIMSTSIVAMSAWCDRSDLFALLQKFQDDLCIEALQRAVQRVLGSNQNMDHITLPSGLQSPTCGCHFNQNIDNTALPSGLQSLTFG